jgi:membrane protease YdiL (CAAX protease family)
MTASAALAPAPTLAQKPLKPMGWIESLLLFGIPTAAIALAILWLWPALAASGVSKATAYVVSLSLVNAGLLAAALVGYKLEGNPWTWPAFSQRMRLTRMSGRVWLWAVGGTLVFGVMALLINNLAVMVYQAIGFTMPDSSTGPMTIWMHIIVLFFNIAGEELWWRGYILPRQELAFRKSTWFIHGILWACFHMFKWYAVPFMLITCQVIPYVAQRTRNTWPAIINHLAINGAGVILSNL